MLGYEMNQLIRGSLDCGRKMIMDSIDRGIPVITLEGVIRNADVCAISGHDNGGDVLLGYNPLMNVSDDHDEQPDDTGYFRKSHWEQDLFPGQLNGLAAHRPSQTRCWRSAGWRSGRCG